MEGGGEKGAAASKQGETFKFHIISQGIQDEFRGKPAPGKLQRISSTHAKTLSVRGKPLGCTLPCQVSNTTRVHPFKIQQEHLILGGTVGLGAARGHGVGTRTVTPQDLQYPVAHKWNQLKNTQQDLSKQDLSRRVWKGAELGSGTIPHPPGKRQLQVLWLEQLCQDILEWAGSLPRQRGTPGLWDRQGTHPSATSVWGMFWDATSKSKQQGWGTRGALGGRWGGRSGCTIPQSHAHAIMPGCHSDGCPTSHPPQGDGVGCKWHQ